MPNQNVSYHEKKWGYEKWIVNKKEYCGKLLFIESGKHTSWHYHKIKDEVMFVQSGKITIYHSEKDDINTAKKSIISKGEAFHIPIGLRHRIVAEKDSEVFEFSTQHFNEDSIRLIRS